MKPWWEYVVDEQLSRIQLEKGELVTKLHALNVAEERILVLLVALRRQNPETEGTPEENKP